MMKFPMNFEVEAVATGGMSTTWTTKEGSYPPITCAIPPEFMGPGGGYSPETLLTSAIISCLIAMFKFNCEKAKVTFQGLKGKATLSMNLGADKSLQVTSIEISIDVTGASDPTKGKTLLDDAIQKCPISNSLKSSICKSFQVTVA